MIICKNCGVELEDDMQHCPLCGETVGGNNTALPGVLNVESPFQYSKMTRSQRKFTWDIVSLILFSGAITTFVVDYIMNRFITWSELPLAISLAVFCYISLFTFWDRNNVVKMTSGFILASFCLVILDVLTGGIQWALKLGLPLLFAVNVVILSLVAVINGSKHKGINLIAYAILGAALLCMCVDCALFYFKKGTVGISWSIIVVACTVPVSMTLLFVQYRLKKGRNLERTFHL